MNTRTPKLLLAIPLWLFMFWAASEARELPATNIKIGEEMGDLSLPDVNGKMHSLREFKQKKVVVLIFIGAKCPSSNAFNQVMTKLAHQYAKLGAVVVGINANKTDSVAEIAEHASTHGLHFLVLKDQDNVVADRLGASVTPEVFLLDKRLGLRYHGALGNSHNPTTKPEQATDSDIRPALEAVLAGRPVAVVETRAFG